MMIQLSDARELCSESEWELVEKSFSPIVETLSRSDVESGIACLRQLHPKTTNVISFEHSAARKHTALRKTELFSESIGRLETILSMLQIGHSGERAPKNADADKMLVETRALNMEALQQRVDQEFVSQKSHILSTLGLRGEQQGQKSGAKHIQSHVGSVNRKKQGRRDTKNH